MYIRINKIQARKCFMQGDTIRVVPCKYRPDNTWITYDINANDMEMELDYDFNNGNSIIPRKLDRNWLFNNWCIRWYYYNGCYEMGYYPAFYVKDNS